MVGGTCGNARSRRVQSDMDQSWEMAEEREIESNLKKLRGKKVGAKKKNAKLSNVVRAVVQGRADEAVSGANLCDVIESGITSKETEAELTKPKLDKTVGEGEGTMQIAGSATMWGRGEGTVQILGSANKTGSEF